MLKTLIVILIAISTGIILGYHYKKPNEGMLAHALSQSSEWKKDAALERIRARTSFFELSTNKPFTGEDGNRYYSGYGKFHFNWVAFFMGTISVMLIYMILTKTILLDLFQSKMKRYLK
ncbi:hypothetical protein U8527_00455 [Kordia algicida OT-1]|nr:hypothetical protein [Kordia algicida]